MWHELGFCCSSSSDLKRRIRPLIPRDGAGLTFLLGDRKEDRELWWLPSSSGGVGGARGTLPNKSDTGSSGLRSSAAAGSASLRSCEQYKGLESLSL